MLPVVPPGSLGPIPPPGGGPALPRGAGPVPPRGPAPPVPSGTAPPPLPPGPPRTPTGPPPPVPSLSVSAPGVTTSPIVAQVPVAVPTAATDPSAAMAAAAAAVMQGVPLGQALQSLPPHLAAQLAAMMGASGGIPSLGAPQFRPVTGVPPMGAKMPVIVTPGLHGPHVLTPPAPATAPMPSVLTPPVGAGGPAAMPMPIGAAIPPGMFGVAPASLGMLPVGARLPPQGPAVFGLGMSGMPPPGIPTGSPAPQAAIAPPPPPPVGFLPHHITGSVTDESAEDEEPVGRRSRRHGDEREVFEAGKEGGIVDVEEPFVRNEEEAEQYYRQLLGPILPSSGAVKSMNHLYVKSVSPLATEESVKEFLRQKRLLGAPQSSGLTAADDVEEVTFLQYPHSVQRYCRITMRTSAGITTAMSLNGEFLNAVPATLTVIDPGATSLEATMPTPSATSSSGIAAAIAAAAAAAAAAASRVSKPSGDGGGGEMSSPGESLRFPSGSLEDDGDEVVRPVSDYLGLAGVPKGIAPTGETILGPVGAAVPSSSTSGAASLTPIGGLAGTPGTVPGGVISDMFSGVAEASLAAAAAAATSNVHIAPGIQALQSSLNVAGIDQLFRDATEAPSGLAGNGQIRALQQLIVSGGGCTAQQAAELMAAVAQAIRAAGTNRAAAQAGIMAVFVKALTQGVFSTSSAQFMAKLSTLTKYPPESEQNQIARTLFVGGVPECWTSEVLMTVLRDILGLGTVTDLKIGVLPKTPQRFALVEFRSSECVDAAVKMPEEQRVVEILQPGVQIEGASVSGSAPTELMGTATLRFDRAQTTVRPREPDNVSFTIDNSINAAIPIAYQSLNKITLEGKLAEVRERARKIAEARARAEAKQQAAAVLARVQAKVQGGGGDGSGEPGSPSSAGPRESREADGEPEGDEDRRKRRETEERVDRRSREHDEGPGDSDRRDADEAYSRRLPPEREPYYDRESYYPSRRRRRREDDRRRRRGRRERDRDRDHDRDRDREFYSGRYDEDDRYYEGRSPQPPGTRDRGRDHDRGRDRYDRRSAGRDEDDDRMVDEQRGSRAASPLGSRERGSHHPSSYYEEAEEIERQRRRQLTAGDRNTIDQRYWEDELPQSTSSVIRRRRRRRSGRGLLYGDRHGDDQDDEASRSPSPGSRRSSEVKRRRRDGDDLSLPQGGTGSSGIPPKAKLRGYPEDDEDGDDVDTIRAGNHRRRHRDEAASGSDQEKADAAAPEPLDGHGEKEGADPESDPQKRRNKQDETDSDEEDEALRRRQRKVGDRGDENDDEEELDPHERWRSSKKKRREGEVGRSRNRSRSPISRRVGRRRLGGSGADEKRLRPIGREGSPEPETSKTEGDDHHRQQQQQSRRVMLRDGDSVEGDETPVRFQRPSHSPSPQHRVEEIPHELVKDEQKSSRATTSAVRVRRDSSPRPAAISGGRAADVPYDVDDETERENARITEASDDDEENLPVGAANRH